MFGNAVSTHQLLVLDIPAF